MTLYVAWVEHRFCGCAMYSFHLLFACGNRAVSAVKVSGEAASLLLPGGFSVKAVERSHDLSYPAPTSIATCTDLFSRVAVV